MNSYTTNSYMADRFMAKTPARRPKTKRLLIFIAALLSLALMSPLAAFATDTPPPAEGGAPAGFSTLTIEYRYAEGELPDIPEQIERFGMIFYLVSLSEPVLEDTLADERTYTIRIEGTLTEEQVKELGELGDDIVLTPVDVIYEREVDKVATVNMPTNDVDDIPLYRSFSVTSGTDPSGFEDKDLKRTGVTFELANPPLDKRGLPAGYVATVVYRGIETYAEVGYYYADITFKTTTSDNEVNMYVIVAEYATEAMAPPIDEITEEEPPPEAGEDEALFGITDDRIPQQSGNPLIDIANGNVPLGNFTMQGVWSFLSFMLCVAALAFAGFHILGAAMRRKHAGELEKLGFYNETWLSQLKQRKYLLSAMIVIFSVITLVAWLYLDDTSLGMVWINGNTLTIALFFAVTLGLCAYTSSRDRKLISDEEDKEGFRPPEPSAA